MLPVKRIHGRKWKNSSVRRDSADAKKIVAFHPEEAAVEIDLGKRVKIYVHEGIEQNAGRYYDIIKKFRKKKEGALRAMKTVLPKKKVQKRDFIPMKKVVVPPFSLVHHQ